jgi:hypothetical protein
MALLQMTEQLGAVIVAIEQESTSAEPGNDANNPQRSWLRVNLLQCTTHTKHHFLVAQQKVAFEGEGDMDRKRMCGLARSQLAFGNLTHQTIAEGFCGRGRQERHIAKLEGRQGGTPILRPRWPPGVGPRPLCRGQGQQGIPAYSFGPGFRSACPTRRLSRAGFAPT